MDEYLRAMISPIVLTTLWVEKFVAQWNCSLDACNAMKGAAQVRFVEVGEDTSAEVVLVWDDDGRVSVCLDSLSSQIPKFTADSATWLQFVNGELEATKAVLTRRIHYAGSIIFAFQYGASFNWVHKVLNE